jgi:hypothetical protein
METLMQERTYTLIAAFACGALALWVIFYFTESPPDAASDKRETVLWSPQKQVNDQLPQEEISLPSSGKATDQIKEEESSLPSSGKLTDQIPPDENASSESGIPPPSPESEVTYQPPEGQNSGTSGKQIHDQIPPEN